MEPQPVDIFAFKSDQQCPECVNPGKGALNHKVIFVHVSIKMALPAPSDRFSVALVFINIGDDATIPEHFAHSMGVKAAIGIEYRTLVVQITAFHIGEELFDRQFYIKSIVMVASHNLCRGNNVAVLVRQWQDITGLCFLSSLIRDAFAPFLATVWLPSRFSSDKFNSYLTASIPASTSRWKLPSWLHLRK
jgi:hypothetical protein